MFTTFLKGVVIYAILALFQVPIQLAFATAVLLTVADVCLKAQRRKARILPGHGRRSRDRERGT